MSLKKQYERLLKHSDVMKLYLPVDSDSLRAADLICGTKIPSPLIELLGLFDGGEIFIPGTVFFGMMRHGKIKSLADVNAAPYRSVFSMPDTCVVFAKLNYGDLICINSTDNSVIQWDHEKDEEYLKWGNLEKWLSDSIDDYEQLMEEGL